ncbi:MAG TPA: 5'-nucleotidase C-terminal domain-containing protein [Clostridia bacterium]|nr:5'-nucleotidase C-terminal domain-containing protein [Clostridia bacterium]
MKNVQKRLSWMLTLIMILSMLLPMGSLWAEDNALNPKTLSLADQKGTISTDANLAASSVSKQAAADPAGSMGDVTVTLLATADVHGRIYAYDYAVDEADPDAGFAKIQTLIKQEKANNPNAILLDVGDTVQDNSAELFNDLPVHPMVQSMNKMGYDAWVLGNHEFNFEKAFLDRNIAAFKGAVLAANIYKEDGSRFVKPYTIINKDGVRIAIVGLITPHIPRWEASSPEHFKGLTFTKTIDEAKKTIKELSGKYDLLIGAFHEGRDGEYGHVGIKSIAEACPEFDVIFGGHEHAKYDDLEVNGVKLIEPGAYGAALAKANISVKKSGSSWTVVNVETKNIDTLNADEDKDLQKEFEFVHKQSIDDANVVIGEVTEDFVKNVDYITGDSKVTTMPTAQIVDTALIDLINEVQLYYTKAEISAAAAFKNDMNLVAGPFKKKNVADIYKYTNTLMGVNITGENLKKYMEWSASYYNTVKDGDITISFDEKVRGYNYDMFAGVSYDIDISKPAGSRIVNATINGEPLDSQKVYKLAVNNYRFGTLTSLNLVTDADVYYDSYALMGDKGRIRDIIGEYVKTQKNGKVSPVCDNNWKIIGFDFNHPLKDTVYGMIKSGEIQIPTSEDGRTPNVKAVNVYDLSREGIFKVVDIVSFNDFHGNVAEDVSESGKNVGMAKLRRATYDAVEANPNTIIVSGGDNYQGTAISNLTYGAPVSEMMKAMGVVASAVGNHEFDWGADRIAKWAKDGNLTFLASNIYNAKTGKPVEWAKPYLITEKGGVKIALIGLAHPDTPTLTKAQYVAGLEFRDYVTSAQEWIDYLKAGKAPEGTPDVIIALTHLDSAQDSKTKEITGNAAELCKKVTGLDGVISAHSHLTVSGEVNSVPVVQAYYNGRTLGKLSVYLDKDGKLIDIAPSVQEVYKVKNNIIPDPDMKLKYDVYTNKLAPILEEKLGTATAEFTHDRDSKGTVSLLGKWSSDVMRSKTGVQVAIQNGGGLRRSLLAGDITMGDLYEIMPFDNYLVTMELPGKDLKKAIDHGINNPEVGDGQFSGLKVTYDPNAEHGNRILTITLEDGTPIKDDALYTVVVNDFMFTGGDKYDFTNAKNVTHTFIPIRDVLVDAIKEMKTLTPVQPDYLTPVEKTSYIFRFAA